MSETKPNVNKNRKAKKKNQLSLDDKNTTQEKQHNTDRRGKTQPHLKGLHLVGVVSGKLNQSDLVQISKKQEPKIHLHYEAPAPHPLMASEHTKQWESGVAPLQPTALS